MKASTGIFKIFNYIDDHLVDFFIGRLIAQTIGVVAPIATLILAIFFHKFFPSLRLIENEYIVVGFALWVFFFIFVDIIKTIFGGPFALFVFIIGCAIAWDYELPRHTNPADPLSPNYNEFIAQKYMESEQSLKERGL